MKKLLILTLTLGLLCFSAPLVAAQNEPTQQPTAEELEKEKAEREKNAYRLLDQVIDEAQSLRLTENRVRIQINAADMLWDQNQGRARSLFQMAAEGITEIGRMQPEPTLSRRAGNDGNTFVTSAMGRQNIRSFQLRQDLVLAAAKHDAALAYQLLAATKPPPQIQSTDPRGPRQQFTSEENLEQTLLGQIAALDPKLAAQNAEQMIEKGQFPRTLPEVINQLQRQDSEAASKLAEKTVRRIQTTNILTNNEASSLAQRLIAAGPRPPGSATPDQAAASRMGRGPVLEQSAYVDLLSTIVELALKATPSAQNNQRGQGNPRRITAVPGVRQNSGPQQPTEAQVEQANARRLLASLQASLPTIDQYLPAKSQPVRQKLTEMGMGNTSIAGFAQTFNSLQGNPTAEALVQAAASAPPQMQARLYQQAAYKALEEGDTERARQIATNLQPNVRDSVMKRIDLREAAKKADSGRLEDVRQAVAKLQSDNEKIDMLIQVANDVQKDNPKFAIQLLEEARQLTNRRATRYDHFEQQLKVARAFGTLDPARSFEVLDPGISQLNELLAAASVLSGFEINMFRDGEMAIQGGNGLTSMVGRYGQELAQLARKDFERSETLAGRFQFAEPRIMTRMAIVQGLLGMRTPGTRTGVSSIGENFVIRQ